MSEVDTSAEAVWLIIKRGYYYRPESSGYTAIKSEAGRYTLEDTAARFPNESDSGLSFIHEDDAPDYSPACDAITKMQHRSKLIAAERDALKAEVERLQSSRLLVGYRGANAVPITLIFEDGSELEFEPDRFTSGG